MYDLPKHLAKRKKLPKYADWGKVGSQAIQDITQRHPEGTRKAYKLFFSNLKRKVHTSPLGFKKVKRYTMTLSISTLFCHQPHCRRWLSALLLAVSLGTLVAPSVQAATLTVTNTDDSGAGSLRQAISTAAANDTIVFTNTLSGATLSVTSTPLVLTKPLTIDGSALPVALTLDGKQTKPLFLVNSSVAVTLTRLTLVNGQGTYGGAIYNGGTTLLDRVTLSNNQALGGGAIYNVGTLTLRNSTLSGNHAFSGGAIDNYGPLTIQNSTFSGNSANNTGGGLFNAGTLYLYNSILADSSGGDCLNAHEPFFNLIGVIASNVHNLTEDGSCNAALSGDPGLAALGLIDGALVHNLAANSPAIDAGDNATCLTTDQRGALRPLGPNCDLGALEIVTEINTGNSVTQTTFSSLFSGIPQPCANVAPPGLPRHTITPTLRNNATAGYRDLYFIMTELGYTTSQAANIPILCNADSGASAGVGGRLTPALTDNLADNLLASGETFAQALVVGLPVRARYRLFVDLYGVPISVAASATSHAQSAQPIGHLGWELDPEHDLIDGTTQLFLPIVVH